MSKFYDRTPIDLAHRTHMESKSTQAIDSHSFPFSMLPTLLSLQGIGYCNQT